MKTKGPPLLAGPRKSEFGRNYSFQVSVIVLIFAFQTI